MNIQIRKRNFKLQMIYFNRKKDLSKLKTSVRNSVNVKKQNVVIA